MSYDPNFKVNPPLRSAADVEAVRAAVADGTIDCLASDHAPRYHQFLVFGRFILWPAVGLLVLLITSQRFRAGIQLAIGHPLRREADCDER